jgi:hypothetical protein
MGLSQSSVEITRMQEVAASAARRSLFLGLTLQASAKKLQRSRDRLFDHLGSGPPEPLGAVPGPLRLLRLVIFSQSGPRLTGPGAGRCLIPIFDRGRNLHPTDELVWPSFELNGGSDEPVDLPDRSDRRHSGDSVVLRPSLAWSGVIHATP